jgi:hypothetical protein
MCHFVVIGGTPYFWAEPDGVPTFPIVVTEGAAAASKSKSMSAVKTSKRIQTFTNMPKFLKASDFEKAYMIR